MTGYYLASENVIRVKSDALQPVVRDAEDPGGRVHAVDRDTDQVACARSVDEMWLWPHVGWTTFLGRNERCPECTDLVGG